MLDTSTAGSFRKSFPVLKHHHYLDSATINLVPTELAKVISTFLTNGIDLAGKGLHELFLQTKILLDSTRKNVKKWMGLPSRNVIFSHNLVTSNEILCKALNLDRYDSLDIISAQHSSFLPYQRQFITTSKTTFFASFSENAALDYQSLDKLPSRNNLVILSPVLLGTGEAIDINKLLTIFDPDLGNDIIIDASLCSSYLPFSHLQPLNPIAIIVDSSLSLFSPRGSSFISVKEDLTPSSGNPLVIGDLVVANVKTKEIDYEKGWRPHEAPYLEPSKIAGLKLITNRLDSDFIEKNARHCSKMIIKISNALEELGFITHGPEMDRRSTNIVGFNLDDVSCHDLAMSLDECNIQVRSGLLCAHPLMDISGLRKSNGGLCQVSVQYYNTEEDLEALVEGLDLIKKQFN
ncbi:MAG: aminotransferase class V-fold PLP-dependent enzyme [Candidatus Hodarchaeales archaeon]|jgi:cysteine desulfurase/selenocysteine lyase